MKTIGYFIVLFIENIIQLAVVLLMVPFAAVQVIWDIIKHKGIPPSYK